jgi:NitT/TauT family transport system substrate-binding protein
MMVRQDLWRGSVPATIRDLKGSKIAVSAKASSAYFMVLRFLAAHDLAPDDVEIVELAYPNMLPALKNGAVDVVHSLEPFGALIRDAGLGAMVSDLTEVVPPQGFNLVALVYGEGFIARRATAQAFMTAYMRGVRVYNDAFGKGKDRDEVTEIIARHARLDPKLVADAAPAGLDPDQRIDRATLQTLQQFFLDQHYLSAPVDLARLVDSSFAEAAVAALGAYR